MAKKEKDIAALMYDFVQSIKVNYMPEAFFKGLMQIYGCSLDYLERALSNDRAVNVGSEIVNESMARSDLALSQMVYFRFLKKDEDVEESFNQVLELKEIKSSKNKIQFIICAGPATLYIYDRISDDSLSIETEDLSGNYLFLMPLIEGRKQTIVSNKEADKRACTKLTRLLDVLANHNNIEHDQMHKLNSFIRRILFCLFAEDTGIFSGKENIFTNAFNTFVDKKGSNAREFFEHLFLVLNTKEEDRENLKNRIPELFMAFPYVNGGLFRDTGFIPEFNVAARNQFIDCGRLTWRDISPAIFGSMFQSAMDRDARRTLGAHYTSEENILKIIKPLFLDDLYAEFEQLKENTKHIVDEIEAMPLLKNKRKTKRAGYSDYISEEAIKLDLERKQYFKDFLLKIGSLKFLDPACGCGNFLLIAYKELRELENAVLEYINEGNFTNSHISINQFYGIEIEDWPAEIAHVSMWLMQHLMNKETNIRFGTNIESIPLKTSATIVTANALTIDWNTVLKATECSYILGNPPFGGTTYTTAEQKKWLKDVYPEKYKLGLADFVTAWFVKASDYMQSNKNIECGFVATNSICQGEQVNTLWGLLLEKGIKINFAYSSFPWTNEATGKAAVTCVITGFSYKDKNSKLIYQYNTLTKTTDIINCINISPYISNCIKPIIICKKKYPISALINLEKGNQATDGGNLLFEYKEGQEFLQKYPETKPYIKKFIGSSELMKSEFRYCLWLTEAQRTEWSQISAIKDRVNKCLSWRSEQVKSGDAYKLKDIPWSFRTQNNPDTALVVPSVTSENRYYVPIDFIKNDSICNNLVFMLPNASHYDFGILTSRMHMVWMKLTCGRLGTGFRYSRDLTYNTFIWPNADEKTQDEIVQCAKQVRLSRARHASMALGDMYKENMMPEDLKEAHEALDRCVEKAYRSEPFFNDDERLEFLLDLYTKAIAAKKDK